MKKLYVIAGCNGAGKTTLATKSYVNLIKSAKEKEYQVTLLFFWLHLPELAVSRVKNRVKEGGRRDAGIIFLRMSSEEGMSVD